MAAASAPALAATRDKAATGPSPAVAPVASKRKLSYKEQRELEGLPALIEALEQEQKAIQSELASGAIFSTDATRAVQLTARSEKIEGELMAALERWDVLGRL
jgi:ATP-binding cassette subfamily F protein uup